MAGARKLQAEIDRVLKKVQEGVEKFEETWGKVHNASNQNQKKEKYEEDLKKEIKKLQRLRDQIKSWLNSPEVKDKSVLLDHRKLVETQMERFKVVERETKTKAYSKEGLTGPARLDPAERERGEITQWLNHCIDTLNIQVDQFEAELETLNAGTKKKKWKSEDNARQEECQIWIEKNREHIQRLELLLRMLDNNAVEIRQIKHIQDDLNDYMDNSQEPDFVENEFIYDDIEGLEEMLLDNGATEHTSVDASETASSTNSVSGNSPVLGQSTNSNHNHSSDTGPGAEDIKRRHRSSQSDESKTGNKKVNIPSSPLPSQVGKISSTPTKSASQNLFSLSQSPNNTSPSSGGVIGGLIGSTAVGGGGVLTLPNHHVSSSGDVGRSIGLPLGSLVPGSIGAALHAQIQQPNFAAAAAQQNGHAIPSTGGEGSESGVSPPPDRPELSPPGSGRTMSGELPAPGSYPHPSSGDRLVGVEMNGTLSQHSMQSNKELPEHLLTLKSLATQALTGDGTGSTGVTDSTSSQVGLIGGYGILDQERGKTEAHIPPLLGVAPLGPVPLSKHHQFQYSMLEAACQHLPHPSDSERLRPYLPRNPCNTPPHYPQVPPQGNDTIDFFTKLSTETLFFVFYYMEGTKAQYLAAKALKKQSWRFHTKYMMWFQRHEEPKVVTDEYEQGTYIYFDYEKWGQRKKEGFTFEYRFLEDRDLN